MKFVYLTVDLEEWYELEYLREFNLNSTNIQVIPDIIDFLNMLDELKVKATFFVVAEIAEKNIDIIKEIVKRGHTIGCHGFDHIPLNKKTNEQYFEEIVRAKELIENICGCPVDGYRASCFSMDKEKLDITRKAGFKYDSSKILFMQHPLYKNLDLTNFKKVDDLIYVDNSFVEYEIPTLKIAKFSIPISGGGYLRLFPYWVIKILLSKYEKLHHNFLIYIHPFELTDINLPLPGELSKTNKFRCLVGRKHNLKKLNKLIKLLKLKGADFRTLDSDRITRINNE